MGWTYSQYAPVRGNSTQRHWGRRQGCSEFLVSHPRHKSVARMGYPGVLGAAFAGADGDGFLGFSRAGGGHLGNFSLERADVEFFAQLGVHSCEDVFVLLEEGAGIFTALADAFARVAVPRAGLFNDVGEYGLVKDVAFFADALAVEDVELRLAEGGSNLVFDDLDLGAVASAFAGTTKS